MLKKLFLASLSVTLFSTLGSVVSPAQSAQAQAIKFTCDTSGDVPATVVRIQRGNIALIQWKRTIGGGDFDPITRCNQVSNRFQSFHERKQLRFLTTGRRNGENIICVADERNGPCLADGQLFTLKPGANPRKTLEQLANLSSRARGGPISESTGERLYVDMDKLLEASSTEGADSQN
jgi:hypothetical protein